MKPQLSLVSVRSGRVCMALLVGSAPVACGEASTDTPEQSATLLLAQGSEGFGAVFAAGGKVGTATVFAPAADGRSGQRCDVNLDSSNPAADCERYCSDGDCSKSVERAVHLLDAEDEDAHCFSLGVEGDAAVRLDCAGRERLLPLPESVGTDVDPSEWRFAADPGVSPLLAVASPKARKVWYYAPTLTVPVEVTPATETIPEGFGADVAVMRLGADRFHSRIIAVGAPGAGQVWLLRAGFPSIDAPLRIGCLGDREDFGRRLAAGDLDGDGLTDLLVADSESVTAFSGAALAAVLTEQEVPACSLGSLPDGAILASVSCASGGLTSGCEDADFGASIAVADLDGDADGELVIGAPGMRVANEQAGAVLVYDAEGDDPNALTETVVDESMPVGSRFGSALGVVQGKNVDALVVGAPGRGAVLLASCFSLTRPELRPKICGGS